MNMKQYYYCSDGSTVYGPVTIEDLIKLRFAGDTSDLTQVCEEGKQDWITLENMLSRIRNEPKESTPRLPQKPPVGFFSQFKDEINKYQTQKTKKSDWIPIIIVTVIGFIIMHAITNSEPGATATWHNTEWEQKSPAAKSQFRKEVAHFTYNQGYQTAKTAGNTGDVAPLIASFNDMGYSAAYIRGFKDGVKENKK